MSRKRHMARIDGRKLRKKWGPRPDLAERNRRRIWTAEARERVGLANRGRRHVRSEEYKRKLSAALTEYYSKHPHHKRGKPHSLEHSRKIALALTGKPLSAERRAKISAAHKGKRTYNWTGYFRGYPEEKWFEARAAALERDGRVCMLAASHSFAGYRNPDVHHINAIKDDCSLPNLICLCKKCHAVAQGNLAKSAPYLREILSMRYGYIY